MTTIAPMAMAPLDPHAHSASSSARSTMGVQLVPLDDIRVPPRRLRSRTEVDGLRESIAANGLLQPVVLDSTFALVCGLHRLEACRALGWREIPAVVRAWSEAEAQLAEIDENLCRRELSVLERAEHIAQRKRIWDELRAARAAARPANDAATPEKGKKKKGEGKKSKKEEIAELAVFVDETAKKTGRATNVVREEIRIGELPEEVRSIARETPLCNNRRELLALTRMPEEEQREALERVRAGEAKSVRKRAARTDDDPEELQETIDGVESGERKAGVVEGAFSSVSELMGEEERARMIDADPATLTAIGEALDDARRAIERALSLWPEEPAAEDGAPNGARVLQVTMEAIQRLSEGVRAS